MQKLQGYEEKIFSATDHKRSYECIQTRSKFINYDYQPFNGKLIRVANKVYGDIGSSDTHN